MTTPMDEPRPYVPIILIGAGRSGTKMLRDALIRLPGAGTWPCDEINYIWRHGNATHPDDEFEPSMARPRVRRFIRQAFARLARRQQLTHVIEKTCANSLRVRFVGRIFPEARFIFLVRDGRDVTASAMQRWRATLDFPYLARKARFVPVSDMPYYGLRYLRNQMRRLTSPDRRLRTWGPQFKGLDEVARTEDLAVICARQWVRCVEQAEAQLLTIPQERVFRLYYEDFVRCPSVALRNLAAFLEIDVDATGVNRCVQHVSSASVGRWRERLKKDQLETVQKILDPTLIDHDYAPSS